MIIAEYSGYEVRYSDPNLKVWVRVKEGIRGFGFKVSVTFDTDGTPIINFQSNKLTVVDYEIEYYGSVRLE